MKYQLCGGGYRVFRGLVPDNVVPTTYDVPDLDDYTEGGDE